MYRIADEQGTRQSSYVRAALAVAYGLFALAGVLLALSEVPDDLGIETVAFAGFLTLGGLLSSVGTLRARWAGEFTGLPLLASAMLAFAVELLRGPEMPVLLAVAHSTLILALLSARWRVALSSYRFVHRVARLDIERGS